MSSPGVVLLTTSECLLSIKPYPSLCLGAYRQACLMIPGRFGTVRAWVCECLFRSLWTSEPCDTGEARYGKSLGVRVELAERDRISGSKLIPLRIKFV